MDLHSLCMHAMALLALQPLAGHAGGPAVLLTTQYLQHCPARRQVCNEIIHWDAIDIKQDSIALEPPFLGRFETRYLGHPDSHGLSFPESKPSQSHSFTVGARTDPLMAQAEIILAVLAAAVLCAGRISTHLSTLVISTLPGRRLRETRICVEGLKGSRCPRASALPICSAWH